jgi:hypothetical protein
LPIPPGRLRLNHSAVWPSGLMVSRTSENSVDAMPGAKIAASPMISTLGALLTAPIRSVAARGSGASRQPVRDTQAILSKSLIQLVSHVMPPSGEKTCSHRADFVVMRDQATRTGVSTIAGLRLSSHQLDHCSDARSKVLWRFQRRAE